MTREEMIEQIENTILLIKQNGKDWWDERDIPVLEEAIKAMKMEPCEDVVSRQAALDTVDTLRIVIANNLPELIYKSSVLKLLHDLPSVQPGQKIVRCKDCKYVWKEDGWDNLYCNRVKVSGSFAVERDGYCAWAKMEECELMKWEWENKVSMQRLLQKLKSELWMEGMNMTDEYQGVWVRFRDIERIIDKYMKEGEDKE